MKIKTLALAVAAAGALTLSACGGGDDPAVTESVPGSASDSVGGFIAYLRALTGVMADDLEPVDVSSVTGQTSDSTEPESVD